MSNKVAIIGAGPAGLSAAYLLGKAGISTTIFEQDKQYVGGISRTENYKGYYFDIGGHRFFSKSKEVEDFWTEILQDDLLERPRSSRIYYNHTFFAYPLVALEALKKLGLWQSFLCVASYLKAKLFPVKNPQNVEDWVSNQFGKKLYSIFFKTYTEKVWGISCKDISADWAAQRIKGLSLSSAIKNALIKPSYANKEKVIKTLIDSFRYPKKGPGMMWETCRDKCLQLGVKVKMNAEVIGLNFNDNLWQVVMKNEQFDEKFTYVLSSASIKNIVPNILPSVNKVAKEAALQLKYRDFLTVVLICKDKDSFTDNWIYIHDPSVKVGRIQNFKSWSPYMVPDESMACYGLEYFCFEGDGMWQKNNDDLIDLATNEMHQIGLLNKENVVEGYVVRQPKAYPVYDKNYKEKVQLVRDGLKPYKGLYLIGRNGMHKYNNQDHSMMTAMFAAKNIIAGKELYDVWKVNQDAEYQEEGERGVNEGGRLIPIVQN
ncbi:MAG TPA: NAD(P)/FAD-dependent oxidoreductase [Chitinophagaceae bacterium]|nr:NAD(P)/FAD-dependent oxidoreductase [Chitinophagaceae bacterium]